LSTGTFSLRVERQKRELDLVFKSMVAPKLFTIVIASRAFRSRMRDSVLIEDARQR